MIRLILIFLFILSLFSCNRCSQQKFEDSNPNEIVVGTFNIEWLGDGINDRLERREEDYRNIAKIIELSKVEVLGVQEVENINALSRLVKYLPDYSFYLSKDDAPQKVGILFRKSIKVKYLYDYSPIEVVNRKTRPGLVAAIQKGNLDFLVLVVHFKATSRFDDTPDKFKESYQLRAKQAEKACFWIDSVLSAGIEQDVLVLGDFNDSPKRIKNKTLTAFLADSNIVFLTKDIKSCKYQNAYGVDHIVCTKFIYKRVVFNSVRVLNSYSLFSKEQVDKISDHCIVIARFETVSLDNDPSKYFQERKQVASTTLGVK